MDLSYQIPLLLETETNFPSFLPSLQTRDSAETTLEKYSLAKKYLGNWEFCVDSDHHVSPPTPTPAHSAFPTDLIPPARPQ